METQVAKVKEHLEKHKSITSWEAITRYHITRLSAVIYTLIHQYGMNISGKFETKKGKTYKRYFYEGGN